MKFIRIRKSLNLSQIEMAVLFGVPAGTLKNWEQELRSPDSAAITLYALAEDKDQDVLLAMVQVACQKKYSDLKEIQALKKLVTKLVKHGIHRGLLEVLMMKSNSQWTPEQLGFRVTTINF